MQASSLPSPPTGYAAVVCVGPGDREMPRLVDLVASLVRYEAAALQRLVLVDDAHAARDFGEIRALLPAGCLRVLHNPRRSRGNGWFGGLPANTVFGVAAAKEDAAALYVLKLDTDSLVVAPFHQRLTRFFQDHAACGVVGSCHAVDLHGWETAPSTWIVNLNKWLHPLSLRRKPLPRLEQAFFGINRQICRIIRMALEAGALTGYRLGNCAQGGGCAIQREMLAGLWERGWLDESWWPRTDLTKDVVVSLLAAASGWFVRDFKPPGEVFGVQFRGLAFPPETLLARGYRIVHSLKCAHWEEEQALRSRLRTAAERANLAFSPQAT